MKLDDESPTKPLYLYGYFGVKVKMKICSATNYLKPHLAKNLCVVHYAQWKRGTHPELNVLTTKNPVLAFWSKVALTANPDKCWNWLGATILSGYGQAYFKRKHWRAHRLAYFLVNDKYPTGDVLHSCDNRRCVNPKHLREGTDVENAKDKVQRNRQARGVTHGNVILSEQDVRDIRKSWQPTRRGYGKSNPFTISALAKKYNVTRSAINAVVKKINWRHL